MLRAFVFTYIRTAHRRKRELKELLQDRGENSSSRERRLDDALVVQEVLHATALAAKESSLGDAVEKRLDGVADVLSLKWRNLRNFAEELLEFARVRAHARVALRLVVHLSIRMCVCACGVCEGAAIHVTEVDHDIGARRSTAYR